MTYTTLFNAADWHATMALKAYRKRDYEAYTRHICIADGLWHTAMTAEGLN
jgi:hypothetical protein